MNKENPVIRARKKRKRQKDQAKAELTRLIKSKVTLRRPVFFVPGWTDEQCKNWIEPNAWGSPSMKDWLDKVVLNRPYANYIQFSDKESKSCKSFLDFGEIVRDKIWSRIGKRRKFDIVGHSMGGLDVVAAIIRKDKPLKNVNCFITLGTPHQGSQLGEIGPKINKYERHHFLQCINLDPDNEPVQLVNRLKARKMLLERINKLYCFMGTRDMVVMGSARFNIKGLPENLVKGKIEFIEEFKGARHSAKLGITRDKRAILLIVKILLGQKIDKPERNYGYMGTLDIWGRVPNSGVTNELGTRPRNRAYALHWN